MDTGEQGLAFAVGVLGGLAIGHGVGGLIELHWTDAGLGELFGVGQ